MDKRNKAEQFRKAKKNFFKRGYKIGLKSDAEIFILIKRKDKSYSFTNTNLPFCTCQAIDYNKTIAKTATDFEPTSSQERNTGFSQAICKDSALSILGIKAPTPPQLEL
ncbi:uncharacterized protein BP5553_06891 [Venustampulla echinocandica]|uniref:MADS-box domain-containing protein n=1 Tax=Venustampulla echinocandica TaxID=2656787 RepID=A0A370TL80_9HELO|nr:uncharacterized protein BP5553_06891 [Venustampulla echinocandica]RDL36279.1 hypothetical protein BP5553_06891 [Venustampulla echinocandica]